MRRRGTVLLVLGGWLAAPSLVPAGERADEKPIVYTNDDLPPAPTTTGSEQPPPPPLPEPSSTALDLPSYDDHRDNNGHGEGWWRHRAAELDMRIANAMYDAQKAHVDYVKGKVIVDPGVASRSRGATQQLKDLEAEREALGEQLRQSGGFPGWLPRPFGSTPPPRPLAAPSPEESADGDLVWKAVPDARFYIVEVQCLDCCGPIAPCEVQTFDGTKPRLRAPFEAGHALRWRVRALDGGGFGGEWSDWFDFAFGTR